MLKVIRLSLLCLIVSLVAFLVTSDDWVSARTTTSGTAADELTVRPGQNEYAPAWRSDTLNFPAGTSRLAGARSLSSSALSIPRKYPPINSAPVNDSNQSLRALAFKKNILIGTAVAADSLRNDNRYAELLGREFSILTPENVMKFETIHPRKDAFDFHEADLLVDFAQTHNMQVRGHTLVWHRQLPNWLSQGNYSRDELISILRSHIQTVVGHYRGRVAVWDVVNEAVDENGSLRDSIWLRGIGPEYIDLAFRWAHEADPEARLFYNDYCGEGLGPKSDAIYALVQGMRQRGVPIDGVGFQMHLSLDALVSPKDVSSNINRISKVGLEVHVTEMDVRIKGSPSADDLAAQARVYSDILQNCLDSENCTEFSTWGFTDRYSWIPSHFPGYGAPLILDGSYRPKPAYNAMMDLLATH